MNLPEGASLFRSTGLYVDRSGALVPVPKNFEGPFPFFPEGTTTRAWLTVMTGSWEIVLTQNPKQHAAKMQTSQIGYPPKKSSGSSRFSPPNFFWRSHWWSNLLTHHEVLTIHLQSYVLSQIRKTYENMGASCEELRINGVPSADMEVYKMWIKLLTQWNVYPKKIEQ